MKVRADPARVWAAASKARGLASGRNRSASAARAGQNRIGVLHLDGSAATAMEVIHPARERRRDCASTRRMLPAAAVDGVVTFSTVGATPPIAAPAPNATQPGSAGTTPVGFRREGTRDALRICRYQLNCLTLMTCVILQSQSALNFVTCKYVTRPQAAPIIVITTSRL